MHTKEYNAKAVDFQDKNSPDERPIAERFTAIYPCRGLKRDWIIEAVVDDRSFDISGRQLFSFAQFRAAAVEQCGIYLPPCKTADWEALVKQRIAEARGEWR